MPRLKLLLSLLIVFCLLSTSAYDFNLENVRPGSTLLQTLLVPRTVGSTHHRNVQDFLVTTFTENGWTLSRDIFEAGTPLGTKQFTNLVFTLDPQQPKKVLMAAHYDLKSGMNKGFMGAIDSAWSCAFLVEMGRYLANRPCSLHGRSDLTPQIVFFDGEEAFRTWSATDSLYGSRHLAYIWDASGYSKSIELFMLLDLLGAANTRIPNYFEKTRHLHTYITDIEEKLMANRQISVASFLRQECLQCNIQDDHIPFMRLGIPILHIIPYKFPSVWHTAKDDENALDNNSALSIAQTIVAFVSDYLDALVRA